MQEGRLSREVTELIARSQCQDMEEILPVTMRARFVLVFWGSARRGDDHVEIGKCSARMIIVQPSEGPKNRMKHCVRFISTMSRAKSSPVEEFLFAFAVVDAPDVPDEPQRDDWVFLPGFLEIVIDVIERPGIEFVECIESGRTRGKEGWCHILSISTIIGHESSHEGISRSLDTVVFVYKDGVVYNGLWNENIEEVGIE